LKTHCGPHKMPWWVTCGPRVWDPCCRLSFYASRP